MKNTRVPRRYAMAWLTGSEERGNLDEIFADIGVIGRLLRTSREFQLFLSSPVISKEKKCVVFKNLLGGRVSAETVAFIILLARKGREELLPEILEQFTAIRDERLGIVDARVTSVVEFAGTQQNVLQEKLEKYTRKKVRMHMALDQSLKGGLVIQIGDTVLDASVRHQLEMLKSRLLAGGALS